MNDDFRYVRTVDRGALVGPIWIIGWLFTIGYVGLPFLKGLIALVLWPYFLGVALK